MRRTYEERLALFEEAFTDEEPKQSRKRYRTLTGPKGLSIRYFDTRQKAVEYANSYYERTGNLAEIEEIIRPNGRA